MNDEAHLSPALARLLGSVRDLAPAEQISGKWFRILLLSATPGWGEGLERFEHDPSEDALESAAFSAVFHAPKSLTLREVTSQNELEAAIWSVATESSSPAHRHFHRATGKGRKTGRTSSQGQEALRFAHRHNEGI